MFPLTNFSRWIPCVWPCHVLNAIIYCNVVSFAIWTYELLLCRIFMSIRFLLIGPLGNITIPWGISSSENTVNLLETKENEEKKPSHTFLSNCYLCTYHIHWIVYRCKWFQSFTSLFGKRDIYLANNIRKVLIQKHRNSFKSDKCSFCNWNRCINSMMNWV